MNRTLSIHLDFLRFFAACAVFMAHLPMFIGGYLWQLGQWGHQAVVVFFVLSGFVIAFVTDGREKNVVEYAINRATRIYSVAIPALIISILVFYWALAIKPEVLSAFVNGMQDPISTIFAALTFTNQSWINFVVFANPPYWSLGYEVMYYLFFGVLFYLRGWKRVTLAALILIVMGPSIALYAPLWFIGVLTYHQCKKHDAGDRNIRHLTLFVLTTIMFAILISPTIVKTINQLVINELPTNALKILMPTAHKFPADYVLAIALAYNIYFLNASSKFVEHYFLRFEKIIKAMAKHTFSLYLFHFPILCLFAILIDFNTRPYLGAVCAIVFTPIIIYILSIYTEDKRIIVRDIITKKIRKNDSIVKQ